MHADRRVAPGSTIVVGEAQHDVCISTAKHSLCRVDQIETAYMRAQGIVVIGQAWFGVNGSVVLCRYGMEGADVGCGGRDCRVERIGAKTVRFGIDENIVSRRISG